MVWLRLMTSQFDRYWYRTLFALDLRTGPWKIQKYYFLSMGPQGHPKWCGLTRSDIEVPKVPFLAKMMKMPLVNSKLTESQTKSKSPKNSTFHSFTSNPIILEIFGNFDQVWPRVDSRRALETLILIPLS